MRGTLLAVMLCITGACDDDEGSAMEGIYMVESWTQNEMGCDAEGAPYEFGDPVFFVKYEEIFGYGALNVRGCATLEECRTEYGEDDTIHLGGPSLTDGDDSSGWTSDEAYGYDFEGQCQGSLSRDRLEKSGADGVRIEEREFDVPEFPASGGEDACPEDKVREAGRDVPCATLQVRVGRLIES